ncbi:DUF4214 domain-containing protein [Massilia sp. SM-13]|uniref:DUF4214 domain-containing protein n=1 Tax=Pseudoduganella rhizocola TaxID=3382643 RepID=UPI0038B4FA63
MASLTQSIQQLYIAYFNRPADSKGLAFWTDSVLKGVPLTAISQQFAKTDEYKFKYAGKTPEAVVDTVYQNLFNRAADPAGREFWASGLQKGVYTVDTIVAEVAASAQQDPARGPDTLYLESKVDAAVAYTVRLNAGLPVYDPNVGTGGGSTAFDAGRFWDFESFRFNAGGVITGVAAHQSVSTGGDMQATAAGYVAAATGEPGDGGAAPSATKYAGTLHLTAYTDSTTITARAATLDLTVNAKSGTASGEADITLTGDVQTAVVTLNSGINSGRTVAAATITIATGLGIADDTNHTGPYTELGNLRSLTIRGNGAAWIDNNNGTKLVTVDASALSSVDARGAAIDALHYTSSNTLAETIKLGIAIDHVTLTASRYGGLGATSMDTVTGLQLTLNADGTALRSTSDQIDINNGSLNAVTWKPLASLKDLDLILREAAIAENADTGHDALVFDFGGNTYIYQDSVADGQITEGDTLVKLTGSIDHKALILALA